MKKNLIMGLISLTLLASSCADKRTFVNEATYASYDDYPIYTGIDLGVTYTPQKTTIKLWAPAAQEVKINVYDKDLDGEQLESQSCYIDKNGVWTIELKGDYKNKYYTLQAKYNDKWSNEEADPYAHAVGTNGKRGMIIDMSDTNPEGWQADESPKLNSISDIIVYELHVRDLSISPTSGIKNKGKYLAFTEEGTKNKVGQSTGIDHITELGVTHVHLLPVFDYRSVDESRPNEAQFNWGYDPQNYNTPDGSYATDAADGKVRIREFKQMVEAMHKKGLRVIMDVVYNHTGATEDSNLNQLVPGYYYRQTPDGNFSNASACGNELASERPMVRKFIIESVKYWVNEFHIDGFRFDLMAIHDQETMNQLAKEVKQMNPTTFFYGEGWTAADSPLPEDKRALKKYAYKMPEVAVFSDDIRDGIKGDVFVETSKGYVQGNPDLTSSVMFGIVASGKHPQIDYSKVNYSKEAYTTEPYQAINYVSCHDNNTLYDKLKLTMPKADKEELTRLNALANAIVLTSQGIPFIHAGEEMNRTKNGEHNTYNLPDTINQINWDWKSENEGLFNFYKGLIDIRKKHPAFRMPTNQMIQEHLVFEETKNPLVIAYTITGNANGDNWKNIFVVFNSDKQNHKITLPEGKWSIAVEGMNVKEDGTSFAENEYTVLPQSTVVLFQE